MTSKLKHYRLITYDRGVKHTAGGPNVACVRISCHSANAWSTKLVSESYVKMVVK